MPKCNFNKVALQRYWNRTSARVSLVNLLYIFRTPFPRNTTGWLFLYYAGQMPPEAQWRNREKQNDKEHHEKACFFTYSWVLEWFVWFCFEKTFSSFPMLFVQVGKRSRETLRSSRSQQFFKIGVLKNLSILARNHLCWSLFLIRLQVWRPAFLLKKRFQRRCFPMNITKFLRTAFL